MTAVINKILGDTPGYPVNGMGNSFRMPPRVIDCSQVPAGAGDLMKLFLVPAGARITEAGLRILTAEGGTLTMDLGVYKCSDDSAIDADGLLDGVNGNALAFYTNRKSKAITVAEATGTVSEAAGTITDTAGGAPYTLTEGAHTVTEGAHTVTVAPAMADGYLCEEDVYVALLFNDAADNVVIEAVCNLERVFG